MQIKSILYPIIILLILRRTDECTCNIAATPKNVDNGQQCHAEYKFLGFLNQDPFMKMMKVYIQSQSCGTNIYSGNTFLYQNFTINVTCSIQSNSGDNVLNLNGSINFKNGADICNCTGTTTITCSGNKYLWLIIVGAVVVGVVVIVVIGFFVSKKYKRGKNQQYNRMEN